MDCCDVKPSTQYDYDLAIIGGGSAAFSAAIAATELGKKVVIIEKGTLGGTCVNFGCVPSKHLIRAAETKFGIENSRFPPIQVGKADVDFGALITDKDKLVSNLRAAKYQNAIDARDGITKIQGEAKFNSNHEIVVSGKTFTADRILIATGSQPAIPPIPGLNDSGYLTSTTAFELKHLPKSIAIIGGGYIAIELSQMFHRLGSKVTIIQRSELLFHEDNDLSNWITKYLREEGIEILTHTKIKKIKNKGSEKHLVLQGKVSTKELFVEELIVATGRRPNTKDLEIGKAGVKTDEKGGIEVNSFLQSTQDNIYAAGDVLSSPALVYVAAYEGKTAAINAFKGNKTTVQYDTVPWVIFSDPQIAGVGLNEAQAKASGIEYDVSLLTLANVPRAIAANNTQGFIKLLRKTGTDELIGARVLAHEGSELLMELSLAIKHKIPITQIAEMMHPYLTLSEGVKLAAQTFDKDVGQLSCCAS